MRHEIYKLHSDPGHGWIEVNKSELTTLNIADKISSYSYDSGDVVFLEEDSDAAVFIKAKEKAGVSIKFEEKNYNDYCFIRSLARYR